MAFKQIPNLPPVLGLTGAEQLEVIQAGTSSRVTASQLGDYIGARFGRLPSPTGLPYYPAENYAVTPGNDAITNLINLQAGMASLSAAGGGTIVFGPYTYAFAPILTVNPPPAPPPALFDVIVVPPGVGFLGVKGMTKFDFRSVAAYTTNTGFIKAVGTYDPMLKMTRDVKPTPAIPVNLLPTLTTRAGTVVSAVTDLPHGLVVGDLIWVLASVPLEDTDQSQGVFLTVNSDPNSGRYSARTIPTVVLSVTSTTAFTYTVANTGDTVLTLTTAIVQVPADVIPLASTAGFAQGDTISVRSEAYRMNPPTEKVTLGELHKVSRVLNSTWLLMHSEVKDQFLVADDAKIAKGHMHKGFSMRGIEIIGHGPNLSDRQGDRGIVCYLCENPVVEDCIITDVDQMGMNFHDCINGRAVGNTGTFTATDEAGELTGSLDIQYGIAFSGASTGLLIQNNTFYGGRHAVVQTSAGAHGFSSADRYGIARGITITGNTIHGTWLGGIASHEGVDTLVIANNTIMGSGTGINIRFGRNCIITNNSMQVFDKGVYIYQSIGNLKIHGNSIRATGEPIWVNSVKEPAGGAPPDSVSPATSYEPWGPVSIANNTCIGGRYGIYCSQATPRDDGQIEIVNNIIKDTKTDGIRVQFGATSGVPTDGWIGRVSGNTLIDIGRLRTTAIRLFNMKAGSIDNNVWQDTGLSTLDYGIILDGDGMGDGTISVLNNVVPPGLFALEALRISTPGCQVFTDMPPTKLANITTALVAGVAKPLIAGPLLLLDTEGKTPTDDLVTLQAGTGIGMRRVLRTTDEARSINVKYGTGNIHTGAGRDRLLQTTADKLELVWTGSVWEEVGYVDHTEAQLTFTGTPVSYDFMPGTLPAGATLTRASTGTFFGVTNQIRNPTAAGAVAGTPGTLPTNWVVPIEALGSLVREVVGSGTEDGIPYVDLRWSGTANGPLTLVLSAEDALFVNALNGQTWFGTWYVRVADGTLPPVISLQIQMMEMNSSGTTLGAITFSDISLTGAPLSQQRTTLTRTNNQAATAKIKCVLSMASIISAGTAVDFTLRFAAPFLSQALPALASAATNVARFTVGTETALPLGMYNEPARTNVIRASGNTGAVVGTPGTLPTGWNYGGVLTGITTTILAVGTENGIPYTDIRFNGTTTSVTALVINLESRTLVPAAAGQTWAGGVYCRRSGGTSTNITSTRFRVTGCDSGGATIDGTAMPFTLNTLSLVHGRLTRVQPFANPATVFVTFGIFVDYIVGAIDITLRIGGATLTQSTAVTSPILATGAPVTRAADILKLPVADGLCKVETQTNMSSTFTVGVATGGFYTVPNSSLPIRKIVVTPQT